ncbi:MAG: hypothetical protein ABIP50_03450 [Candidatus Saccharimonadales bacterium]
MAVLAIFALVALTVWGVKNNGLQLRIPIIGILAAVMAVALAIDMLKGDVYANFAKIINRTDASDGAIWVSLIEWILIIVAVSCVFKAFVDCVHKSYERAQERKHPH